MKFKITNVEPVNKGGMRGLGDLIHATLKPITFASDKILHTDLKNCGGCGARKEALNELFPFKK